MNDIFIVINDLKTGGAQNTLKRILPTLSNIYKIKIFTFFDLGIVGNELKDSGYEIIILNVDNPLKLINSIITYVNYLIKVKPKLIISFLYFSDFFSGIISKIVLGSKTKIYWNIRNDLLKLSQTGKLTYFISRLNSKISKLIPFKIVYCSDNSKITHEGIGYDNTKSLVCVNNIDLNEYIFSVQSRKIFRIKYKIEEKTILFGMACRYDKIKNIPLFIESIYHYFSNKKHEKNVKFIISGENIDQSNLELINSIKKLKLDDSIILAGYITNMKMFYSAIDCLVVTSLSEGSPNVIYEALASGAFCISSNCSPSLKLLDTNLLIINDFLPQSFSDLFHFYVNKQTELFNLRIENRNESIPSNYIHNLANLYINL